MCDYKNTDGECILTLYDGRKDCFGKCDIDHCPEKQIGVDTIIKKDYGCIQTGKFKGTEWTEIKEWYLEFLCTDECKTSFDNKRIAKEILENGR